MIPCVFKLRKCLQNWGNYTDISQAVMAYDLYTIDMLLICWFGTQPTQHVRENDMKYNLKL
jgi:hypothetical protein